MKKVLRLRVAACAVFLLCMATAIGASAQTFTTLFSFDYTDGGYPNYGSLVQGFDGYFYGETIIGGAHNHGTVFTINSAGALQTLANFNYHDGANPQAGLVLASDGKFYGTSNEGGNSSQSCGGVGCGTVFTMSRAGTVKTLYNFCLQANCADGSNPFAGLTEGTDGNFYGTTTYGGASPNCPGGLGCGTVFKITKSGVLSTIYSFCLQTNCADGLYPTGLIQARDGNFYGTTRGGGAKSGGSVFKISSGGIFTTLYSFCVQQSCADGQTPFATLTQGTDENFYGTTYIGGGYAEGTVYKITSAGTLTTLHSFDGADGEYPEAGLIQATDGNFYGTTNGGFYNAGNVFEITPEGVLTTLYSFSADISLNPIAGLTQGTDGDFYGTTNYGGAYGGGTVYSLSVGLAPFVETLPKFGKVSTTVSILGNNLTSTTGVRFNGTTATFTVLSSTEIKTTVPTGATSGKVRVTTPHGTLTSNVVFRVK